ncbi:MAG: copper chaperone PCu(A)C [Pseudomonadota bacterium]|nr:copper chaperone PCu(A)C [Pseudomonadota bacterium]
MKTLAAALAAFTFTAAVQAQVTVQEPWVRATVPRQQATGAFMQLSSAHNARLVAAQSPVAGVVEIHEMAMEGDVMKMRALADGLPLPAGQTVQLKPGGYHIMLMSLKTQIQPGQTVPLTLVVQDANGQRQSIDVQASVRALGAQPPGHSPGHGSHGGMKH